MTEPLEDIQDELLERLHAGEDIDREAILASHPDLAPDLGMFLDLLAEIEDAPVAAAPEPSRLGEFRILRELGRGGMGIVYEAEQASLRRHVALKVLPPALRMDERLVSRFRREAEAAGRLRHPGIVPVFSVGEAAGAPFFAMELVEGETLESVIRRRKAGDTEGQPEGPDAWREWCVEKISHVAEALSYAHENGILHRDVKPGNIILGPDGAPRLTDFGLALDMHAPGLTLAGELFGSPQYMSPEQAVRQEAPVDARTDVYSLAVTLYELLSLRLPYDATTSAELLTALVTGNLVPPRRVDPTFPRPLEQVLLRALRKDPRDRYDGPKSFAQDLRAALAGEPVAAPASSARRSRWLLTAVAAVLLVGVAFVFWSNRDDERAAPETASKPDSESLAYWLAIERRLRDGDMSVLRFRDLTRRIAAREVAQRFCRDWNETYLESDQKTRKRYQRLQDELVGAGITAAPYLLEVLGTNQYDSFSRIREEDGVTARMQVRALRGILFLDLKEALPHVLLHCRGPSRTSTSTAALVLQKLTGEEFDAEFLKEVIPSRIDWWAKNEAANAAALNALVDQIIRELRLNVEGKGPKRRSVARDWWSETGKLVVRDLGMLLDTHFPFEATTDRRKKLDQIARIETWWASNRRPE